MIIIPFLLQIAALVCLVFATFGLFPSPRVNWGWAGLLLWLLSLMVTTVQLHPVAGS